MKVDIVMKDGAYGIYPREGAPFRYDGEYESKPLYTPEDGGDLTACEEWCNENGYPYRLRQCASLVSPRFMKDLEEQCDRVYSYMVRYAWKCGWSFSSDVTYRASAAWKENPAHYCYRGDFGSSADFSGTTEESLRSSDGQRAVGNLHWLQGVADGLWELGFTLTFDKDGKHRVFGNYPQWVTLDKDEC